MEKPEILTTKVVEGRTTTQNWENPTAPSPPTAPQEVGLDKSKHGLDSIESRQVFSTIYGYVHKLNRIIQKVKTRMLASKELKLARKRAEASRLEREAIYFGDNEAVADNDPVRFWVP